MRWRDAGSIREDAETGRDAGARMTRRQAAALERCGVPEAS